MCSGEGFNEEGSDKEGEKVGVSLREEAVLWRLSHFRNDDLHLRRNTKRLNHINKRARKPNQTNKQNRIKNTHKERELGKADRQEE